MLIKESPRIPFLNDKVSAGFPSPAEDYIEENLNLNHFLIDNPAATFLFRVSGCSMVDEGIYDGDIIIVDRSLDAKNNDIVVACIDGDICLQKFKKNNNQPSLLYRNKERSITADSNIQLHGIVVSCIKKFR